MPGDKDPLELPISGSSVLGTRTVIWKNDDGAVEMEVELQCRLVMTRS